MQGLENIYDLRVVKDIEEISVEYGKLMDWFDAEYPEATIRLEVNSDQRVGSLRYILTVMTGKEATPNNQGLMKGIVTLTKRHFDDRDWMDKFKKGIVPNYKKTITARVNTFYRQEKERSEAR